MKNEFFLAFNEVIDEKGLPREIILQLWNLPWFLHIAVK